MVLITSDASSNALVENNIQDIESELNKLANLGCLASYRYVLPPKPHLNLSLS